MSQTISGPEWTKAGGCKPRYIWHANHGHLPTVGKFNQAARITLARRQARGKNASTEPELYACKWYPTAGLGETSSSGSSINGLRYIQREAATFASINHPHIVRFQDFSYELGGARLARLYMEYCPQGDLSQFSNRHGSSNDPRLSYDEGLQVLSQLAQALLYLHHGVFRSDDVLKLAKLDFNVFKTEDSLRSVNAIFKEFDSAQNDTEWRTILHRDVKPANGMSMMTAMYWRTLLTWRQVFVSERSVGEIRVKLGDFGLAKFETEGSNSYVGSRDYFAPVRCTDRGDTGFSLLRARNNAQHLKISERLSRVMCMLLVVSASHESR